ncbi:TonB-dependent receptor [Flavobacterium sp. F-380]|uniref:TonB-dependent receptor n=2 Tax=Flavobacterium kayseriense TaxID=2764714 RepID=A0ABR7J5Y7_9FLAO|nr:TonB-dependent receptor [Flavobacterium kayseriense]MBC5846463.1 TonB-dependent receptor [Flavobacterium kayseriense]MBU0940950.1 TonB-dependent receptor [Bacteroidota bacterium]
MFAPLMLAQTQRKVSGTVFSASDNKPLPGASVMVKGTTNGTSTDLDGKFTLSITGTQNVLSISYMGFQSKEVLATSNSLSVLLLEDTNTLTEVVVVGYGTQKKSDVTGAVSKIDVEKAIAIPTTNISEMLRGKAAGVQVTLGSARPGGSSNILIRGRNSIRGGNDPLIVLDGFPIENINDINPDDIASIEVLKDASAQAIYGARASNGVVLVTTKKGKEGKMNINFNSYTTSQRLTKNFDMYNAEEFAQLRREAKRTDNTPSQTYLSDDLNFNGATTPEYINYIAGNYTDWEKTVLKTAFINSNSLSISGGTDKTKIFTSFNYFDQSGLVPSSNYSRGTFRLNIEQKLNDKTSIEANINVASDRQQRESSNLDFITISPFTGPYDADGNLVKLLAGANASSSTVNPLWDIRESKTEAKNDYYNINFVANHKFTSNFSYKLNTLLSRRFVDEGSYISTIHSRGVALGGIADVASTLREEHLIENILNYKTQIGENHKFDFTAVQSVNQINRSRTNSNGTGFGNNILGYDGITTALNFKVIRDEEQKRISSFLGRARYNLMDKYLLTLTARRDGSSVFSENRKWGFFPAVAAAWQIHKESFLKDSKSIDQLKLRLGYGSVGNQSLDPYTTLGVVTNYPYIFGGVIVGGALPGTVLPNPNLTWETSTTANLGIDFGFFNSRITGSVEYYNTRTTDLLTDISLGGTSGFSSTITNGGESKNSGFEIFLNGNIIRSKNLNWNITTAFTKNKNELIKSGIVDIDGNAKDDQSRGRYIGYSINNIRTLVFDGIFQTDAEAAASPQAKPGSTTNANLTLLRAGSIRLKDVNEDGIVNDEDNVIINTDPKWYASVSSTLNFKNFELFADVYIVEGATKNNPYLSSFNQGGTLQSVRNGIKVDYWTPENNSTTFPRPSYASAPANIGTLAVADASYLRLRTLSLGYNFSKSVLDKLHLNNLKLYFTATNLVTITDYKSYSPENNPNDFPDTKSLTVGFNLGL